MSTWSPSRHADDDTDGPLIATARVRRRWKAGIACLGAFTVVAAACGQAPLGEAGLESTTTTDTSAFTTIPAPTTAAPAPSTALSTTTTQAAAAPTTTTVAPPQEPDTFGWDPVLVALALTPVLQNQKLRHQLGPCQ